MGFNSVGLPMENRPSFYDGTFYQLRPHSPNRLRSHYVNILQRPGKPILVESDGQEHSYTSWEQIPGVLKSLGFLLKFESCKSGEARVNF